MRDISIKMGLLMLAGFVSFFLLMYFLGLSHRTELRAFNGVIHFYFLNRAIRAYYALHPEKISNYMSGLAQGMWVSLVGVTGFILFMTIFLSLDSNLMNTIRQDSHLSTYLNPFTACLFIFAEGLVIGLIGSYILTRIIINNLSPDKG